MAEPEVTEKSKISKETMSTKEMVEDSLEDKQKETIIVDKKIINKDTYPIRILKPMDAEEWWLMAGFWFSITSFFLGFLFLLYFFLPNHIQNRNKVGLATAKIASVKYILINDEGDEGLNRMNKIKIELLAKRKTYKYKREVVEGFEEAIARYSVCPSRNYRQCPDMPGALVKEFDDVVFAPESSVGEILGPVNSKYGWYLIFIMSRGILADGFGNANELLDSHIENAPNEEL